MGRRHRASVHRIGIQHPDLADKIRLVKHVTRIMRIARANNADLLDQVNESGDYNDDIEAGLKKVCDAFTEQGAY